MSRAWTEIKVRSLSRGVRGSRPFAMGLAVAVMTFAACFGDDEGTEPPQHSHAVASVTIDPAVATLKTGDQLNLTGVVRCGCGDALSEPVIWSTSDATVASVSPTGRVEAKSFGIATVTGTAQGVNGFAAIEVQPLGTVVGALGGTVVSADGLATLEIPAGALDASTDITVTKADDAEFAGDPLYMAGTAYELKPEALQLRERVRLRIRYDPSLVPPGTFHEQLRLRERERQQQQWRETEQNQLQQNAVEAEIERFGLFAILIQPAVGKYVGPLGGTVVSADGNAELIVPAGALEDPVDITVTPVDDAEFAGDPYFVAGSAYDLEPNQLMFQIRATLRIRYDPDHVPAGLDPQHLRLQERERLQNRWREMQHAQQHDQQQHRVQAEIEHQGRYGIVWKQPAVGMPADIVVSPATLNVVEGDVIQMTAVVLDADGNELAVPVNWSSSDPTIADVDQNGLVTAIAEGSVTITASAGGVNGNAGVTVQRKGQPPASITVTPASATLAPGETVQLVAEARDADGNPVPASIKWSSANTAVATVDPSTGLVTAVGDGVTRISATDQGVTGEATVTVTSAALTIVIEGLGNEPLEIGSTVQLTGTAWDANGNPVNVTLNWSSDNTGIADVDQTGLVTGVGRGTAMITAAAAGASASVQIRVVGESEGTGNNLSWPVVFADGIGLTGQPVGTDTGLRPASTEAAFADYDPAALPFFWTGNTPTYGIYHEQQTFNTWQAQWADGTGQQVEAEPTWGDNLISRTWSASKPIRIEQVLSAPAFSLTGFNMTYLYGDGPTEMQGTDGSTGPFTPTVYSGGAQLIIEKLDAQGGTAIDLVTSGVIGSEVNVGGKVIYGYLLRLTQTPPPDGVLAGWYRITFQLASGANVAIASAGNGTGYTASSAWLEIMVTN